MVDYVFRVEWSKEDGEYIATCPAFPSLSAFGSIEAKALAEGKVALGLFIQSYLADGISLPPADAMSETKLKPYEDPSHELNGPKYKTGKKCIEPDCMSPAGTYWSPYWCFECNVERMKRITKSLEELAGNARGVAFPDADDN